MYSLLRCDNCSQRSLCAHFLMFVLFYVFGHGVCCFNCQFMRVALIAPAPEKRAMQWLLDLLSVMLAEL